MIYYLDEDINIRNSYIASNADRICKFKIISKSLLSTIQDKEIFYGTCFIPKNTNYTDFYVNDILNSQREVRNFSTYLPQSGQNYKDFTTDEIFKEIVVLLDILGDDTYSASSSTTAVILNNRYLNRNSLLNSNINFYDASSFTTDILLQGYKGNELALVPQIPLIYSDKFGFGCYNTINWGNRNSYYITFKNGEFTKNVTINKHNNYSKVARGFYTTMKKIIDNYKVDITQTVQAEPNSIYMNDIKFCDIVKPCPLEYTYTSVDSLIGNQFVFRNTINLDGSVDFHPVNYSFDLIHCMKGLQVWILDGDTEIYRSEIIYKDDGSGTYSETFSGSSGYSNLLVYIGESYDMVDSPCGYCVFNCNGSVFYDDNKSFTISFDYSPNPNGEDMNIVNMNVSAAIEHTYIDNTNLCNSRYFIQWFDRLGGFQSQPFDKTTTYSETIKNDIIKDYTNKQRKSSVSVTPQWKVNTKWIDEKYYPFYESILVSPFVQLYDTKEDEVYDVIVKDNSYTEKTVKNQGRKLFNLSLTLELNKQQTILN